MAHAAAALHELHLFLIDFHDGAIGVGVAGKADDKAVRERGDLLVVADAGHGAARGNDVAEMVEEVENLFRRHRIFVLLFDAGHLT